MELKYLQGLLLLLTVLALNIFSVGNQHSKNSRLTHETIRWKSDVPLTEGQLRSKRDEFWDTAPAFEGKKEIWDALRLNLIIVF